MRSDGRVRESRCLKPGPAAPRSLYVVMERLCAILNYSIPATSHHCAHSQQTFLYALVKLFVDQVLHRRLCLRPVLLTIDGKIFRQPFYGRFSDCEVTLESVNLQRAGLREREREWEVC